MFENFELYPFIDDHDDQWSVWKANRCTLELSRRICVTMTLSGAMVGEVFGEYAGALDKNQQLSISITDRTDLLVGTDDHQEVSAQWRFSRA